MDEDAFAPSDPPWLQPLPMEAREAFAGAGYSASTARAWRR